MLTSTTKQGGNQMDISEIETHSISLLEQVEDNIKDIEWYIENR